MICILTNVILFQTFINLLVLSIHVKLHSCDKSHAFILVLVFKYLLLSICICGVMASFSTCGVLRSVVALSKMKGTLLSIFEISLVSHLVSKFKLTFFVYKQAS